MFSARGTDQIFMAGLGPEAQIFKVYGHQKLMLHVDIQFFALTCWKIEYRDTLKKYRKSHILILGLIDMGFTRDVVLIKDYSIGIKCFQLCNFESFYLCDFQFQLEFSNKMLSRILPSLDFDVKRKLFFKGLNLC